jgi:Zn-dependent M28 family amino/carboxypeptidase
VNNERPAPTRGSAPAPTGGSDRAPASDGGVAPTSGNAIAPTGGRRSAPTRDSALAPTSGSALAPSSNVIFDSARAWKDLQKQVGFGPRPSGSAALDQCRKYILAELKSAGIDARQQVFMAQTPLGEMMMANIIATIPGRRTDRIVFTSHYDTKRAPNFRFVGASDGASSTAALLELGRALKTRQNEYTIELLFVDGEEAVNWDWHDPDNTYGSRYYVSAAQKANTIAGIKALVLLDMIGDRNLLVKRDANSTPWLVDIVWDAAGRLGHRAAFSNQLSAVEDDHVPFLRAGVPSVDIIDLDNYAPYWHTAQDDLEHVSARSLQIVGDVVLAALPDIEKHISTEPRR